MSNFNILLIDNGEINIKLRFFKEENIKVNIARMNEIYNICDIIDKKDFKVIVLFIENDDTGHNDIIELNKYIHRKNKYKILLVIDYFDKEFINNIFYLGFFNIIEKGKLSQVEKIAYNLDEKRYIYEMLADEYYRLRRKELLSILSKAEQEILEHVENGYKRTEIAHKLYKSESTVKNQINSIIKKLNKDKKLRCKNLVDIVKYCELLCLIATCDILKYSQFALDIL
ncbi:MAG: response regulator transcription factor [Clostridiales bacterium]|nr:response regulator transcription factor [Clostridiales bacterium]